jgi:endonuclease-8
VPEGHSLHRLAREHRRLLVGHELRASSPQGRFAEGAALIDGHVLRSADAYGKHLFHDYGAGRHLHVHLGLYGKWVSNPQPAPEPRGALRLRLESQETYADLRGATACELLTGAEVRTLLARLGPDPLRRGSDPDLAWRRISRSRAPIASLLMDQSVVAGIGNVYRAELLFRHRVDPYLPGRDLPRETWDAMWADLVVLMRAGVKAGRIVTTDPADRPAGRVTRENAHYVYRRTGLPCRVCGTKVLTAELLARNLYWCPHCQQ